MQELWVTDVKLSYSEHLAMSQMARLLTTGVFDAVNHMFNINISNREESQTAQQDSIHHEADTNEVRVLVLSVSVSLVKCSSLTLSVCL